MNKNICILGSTGSIGTQTLDVVRNLEGLKVVALSTNKNIELLEKQIEEFQPEVVAIMDEIAALQLRKNIKNKKIEILVGIEGLTSIACYNKVDTVINAVVGNIGLKPTIAAIKAKKNIALANKETLVSAGELVMKEVAKNNVTLYPIDSEHSAIFQCLQGNELNTIKKIYLTASGGPFRNKTLEELKVVTKEQALCHPNWEMGAKITIDSSTLMNKGLEVIEAKWLFNVDAEKIQVLVHPQSIIHSMVEFSDGAVMAQLGEPDMRVPIQYSLTYPKRVSNNYPTIDFLLKNNLTFERPKVEIFRCLQLAFDAIKIGGTLPAVLNAANESCVNLFLNGKIDFLDIPSLIERAMEAYNIKQNYTLEDVFQADAWAHEFIRMEM